MRHARPSFAVFLFDPIHDRRAIAADDGEAIRDLRAELKGATDFREPWKLFHDTVVARDALFDGDGTAIPGRVTDVVDAALRRAAGVDAKITYRARRHHGDHAFSHGCGEVADRVFDFFYFEDTEVGLVAIHPAFGEEGESVFARVTTTRPFGFRDFTPRRARGVA